MRLLALALFISCAASCTCGSKPALTQDGGSTPNDGGSTQSDGGANTNPDAGGGAHDGGLPGSGLCVGAGQPCETTRPCCAGQCDGLVCRSSVFCLEAGSCTRDSDCCNSRCVSGSCSAQSCKATAAACASPTECCTGVCSANFCAAISGGGACKVLGDSCGGNGDCCSSLCRGGLCAKAYYCQPNGDRCNSNDECCGQACSVNDGGAGYCKTVTGGGGGGCTQEGNPCSAGNNCCSRVCFDPGSGATVCLPAGGCRLTGTSCTNDDACCGGGVNPNGSVSCATGRCDNGQSCNGVGNICGAQVLPDGGSVNASQNCCDGMKDVCKLDSSGIPRCFGGQSGNCPTGYTGQAPCCIAENQLCQFRDQCCSGSLCLPADGGVLRCRMIVSWISRYVCLVITKRNIRQTIGVVKLKSDCHLQGDSHLGLHFVRQVILINPPRRLP